ncbi:hypothetical protein [Haloechinothrix salitolerans]|uniref:Phage tail assembly chaperone protein, TAC n=1 Tax=Haloechinothrix salitolerans TaxID=926830 RepID=A0ABW2C342_9PSEU
MTETMTITCRDGAARLADLWFPGTARSPRMIDLPGYESLLNRAMRANPELAQAFVEVAELASGVDVLTAKDVAEWPTEIVEAAWYFLTSTYYMATEVREAVGYPGQRRNPVAQATPDQMVDDDLLAPVLAMGSTYVPTPTVD